MDPNIFLREEGIHFNFLPTFFFQGSDFFRVQIFTTNFKCRIPGYRHPWSTTATIYIKYNYWRWTRKFSKEFPTRTLTRKYQIIILPVVNYYSSFFSSVTGSSLSVGNYLYRTTKSLAMGAPRINKVVPRTIHDIDARQNIWRHGWFWPLTSN